MRPGVENAKWLERTTRDCIDETAAPSLLAGSREGDTGNVPDVAQPIVRAAAPMRFAFAARDRAEICSENAIDRPQALPSCGRRTGVSSLSKKPPRVSRGHGFQLRAVVASPFKPDVYTRS
jgi:hypothetical protein